MQEKSWRAKQFNTIQLSVSRQSGRAVSCFDYLIDRKQRNGFDSLFIRAARYCIYIEKHR